MAKGKRTKTKALVCPRKFNSRESRCNHRQKQECDACYCFYFSIFKLKFSRRTCLLPRSGVASPRDLTQCVQQRPINQVPRKGVCELFGTCQVLRALHSRTKHTCRSYNMWNPLAICFLPLLEIFQNCETFCFLFCAKLHRNIL